MKRENCVLVIAGPSGVGKTVVAEAIVKKDPRFTFLRSGTTRERRGDEHDDEYLYYTEQEFLEAVGRGEFAEHMRYGNNLYGTPKSELKRAFDAGKIPLLVLDLEGVNSLYHLDEYSACSVYIYADIDVIEKRLRDRCFAEGATEKAISLYEFRCRQNRYDFSHIDEYSDFIFSFIENVATIDDCRDKVMDTFKGYNDGLDYRREGNLKIAEQLKLSVIK